MKKSIGRFMAAVAVAGLLAGCSSGNGNPSKTETGKADAVTEGKTDAKGEGSEGASYTIGIGQFAEHGSLDNCREGFLKGLAEEGIVEGQNLTVLYENAQADGGTASQIMANFLAKDVDMICAIATPIAQSAYSAARDKSVPVIYKIGRAHV